ncbi:MAG: DUF2207 domain-containing protein [Bacillota bacterium]
MRRFIPPVLFALFIVLLAGAPAWARSYSFPSLEIEAQVLKDGSLRVTEHRTVRFTGEFHAFDQWIPTAGTAGITDVTVSESGQTYLQDSSERPGTFSVTQEASRTKITWNYEAADEERIFDLSYRFVDVVRVHKDVAELCWKAVGDEWDRGTDRVKVTIGLPENVARQEVRAWAHGPLQGTVSIQDDGSAVLSVEGLPANRFVEARVTFPPHLCPDVVLRSEQAALPGILEEENRWADRANRRRTSDVVQALGGIMVLLGAAGAAIWLQVSYGKEFKPEFKGDYYRELPGNYGPAMATYLLNFGKATPNGFTATILDLARRGYLKILELVSEKKKILGIIGPSADVDYLIELTDKDRSGLKAHEQAIMTFVTERINEDGELSFEGIERYAKGTTNRFRKLFQDWQDDVATAAEKEKFLDEQARRPGIIEMGAGGIVVLAGILSALIGAKLFPICCIPAGLILLFAGIRLRRRSRKGSTHLAMWRAFKRFLLHFSNLEKAQIPALVVWEHYLVYATALGVAAEVLAQLRLVFPEVDSGDYHFGSGWYHYSSIPGIRTDPFTGLAAATATLQQSILTAATYTPSSGGGAGGGFSGGGGGGFGGGGGGAR